MLFIRSHGGRVVCDTVHGSHLTSNLSVQQMGNREPYLKAPRKGNFSRFPTVDLNC